MTLTDMANHICTQVGMTDTDDVSAAMMFLQRRLEMIWNSQLWRDSLVEATLTANPDGSTTLEDTVWLPGTGILLLPSAIEKVIAARTDIIKLEAASLESYYRTDYDWLDYQGTPTDFQVLSPCVWQFSALATLALGIANAADATITANVRTVDASGVSCALNSIALANPQSATFQAERVDTISLSAPQGNVTLVELAAVSVAGITYTGSPQPTATINVTEGQMYQITPGANENGVTLVNGTQTMALQTGVMVTVTAQGSNLAFQYPNLVPAGAKYGALSGEYAQYELSGLSSVLTYNLLWGANDAVVQYTSGNFIESPGAGQVSQISGVNENGNAYIILESTQGAVPVTAQLYVAPGASLTATINEASTLETILAGANVAPLHPRIRLTQIPNVATNLRVLGKKKCPILGAYDAAPITNVEPSLMAFARGDLLLRQRQFGKAALAQQEGATLLKELANDEAIQQAGNFRIDPDNGFGNDSLFWTQPNSLNPLG